MDPPKIKGQSASDAKRGPWGKNDSWMEHDLQISSKGSEVPQKYGVQLFPCVMGLEEWRVAERGKT